MRAGIHQSGDRGEAGRKSRTALLLAKGLCMKRAFVACASMPGDNCVKCFIFSVSFGPEVVAQCQLLAVPSLPYWKGCSLRKEASVKAFDILHAKLV